MLRPDSKSDRLDELFYVLNTREVDNKHELAVYKFGDAVAKSYYDGQTRNAVNKVMQPPVWYTYKVYESVFAFLQEFPLDRKSFGDDVTYAKFKAMAWPWSTGFMFMHVSHLHAETYATVDDGYVVLPYDMNF